jgi:circadian clock protein KaiC
MDLWILLKMLETNGERNRGIYVLKARGMAHSNQIREFRLTDRGIELEDVYMGTDGVLTGTARAAQEAADRSAALRAQMELERKRRNLQRKQALLDANIRALEAEFEAEAEEVQALLSFAEQQEQMQMDAAEFIALRRGRDRSTNGG